MRDESLHDLVHTELLVPRLRSKLAEKHLVVPIVRPFEYLVDLVGRLLCLKALFDHVGREFELAQTHEVPSNEVQYLVVAHLALQLEHILYQIVAKGVLDQEVDPTDNDIGKGQFLLHQAFFKATLHHTASVLVSSNLVTVSHTGVEDELSIGSKRL